MRGFTAWVEAQNPKGRYDYAHKDRCAVGRWLKATDHHMLLRRHWASPDQPVLWQLDHLASGTPHTFGALSKRLRALAETPFSSVLCR